MITVYSKPGCVQCNATYRHLEARGLSEGDGYEKVSLLDHPNMVDTFKANNLLQAPIVVVDGDLSTAFAGFHPDLLDDAISAAK